MTETQSQYLDDLTNSFKTCIINNSELYSSATGFDESNFRHFELAIYKTIITLYELMKTSITADFNPSNANIIIDNLTEESLHNIVKILKSMNENGDKDEWNQ